MKTIAIINQKGGVGKTTTVVNVAHMLATVHHKRVLMCDLDPQANATLFYGHMNPIKLLRSLLANEPINRTEGNVYVEDLLVDSTLDVHNAINHTVYKGLDFIPSSILLSTIDKRLKEDTAPQQLRLKKHLEKIKDEYDYCILDCSPSIDIININGLMMADRVYVPLKCDIGSAIGMAVIKNQLLGLSRTYPDLQVQFSGCFYTQWDNKQINKTVYKMLKSMIPSKILPIVIPRSKLAEEISYMQKPLLVYDKGHRIKDSTERELSKVTDSYLQLTQYIVDHT